MRSYHEMHRTCFCTIHKFWQRLTGTTLRRVASVFKREIGHIRRCGSKLLASIYTRGFATCQSFQLPVDSDCLNHGCAQNQGSEVCHFHPLVKKKQRRRFQPTKIPADRGAMVGVKWPQLMPRIASRRSDFNCVACRYRGTLVGQTKPNTKPFKATALKADKRIGTVHKGQNDHRHVSERDLTQPFPRIFLH